MRALTPEEEAQLPWNDECRSAMAVFLKRYRDTGLPVAWIPKGFQIWNRPRGPDGYTDAELIWRPSDRERTPRVDQHPGASLKEPNVLKVVCHDIEHCLYLVDAALMGQAVSRDVELIVAEGREFFDNSWQEFTGVNAACEAFYFWMSEDILKERRGEPEDEDEDP